MKRVIIPEEFRQFIISRTEAFGGEMVRLLFENGYGASVINHNGSYGLELGVLYENKLTYNTPITNDVLGYLDENELKLALNSIKTL